MHFSQVQSNLGFEFKDLELLHEALTHSSCLNEQNIGYKRHNEAIAWLGDALIHWILSERVYCSELSPEELHNRRMKRENKTFLAELAVEFQLDNALIIPEGRVKEGGRTNEKNLHTVFEAIVGAIFKDQGFEVAKGFVLDKVLFE